MNAIMNEIQLWYCDICDQTIRFFSRLRHFNSKSHKHKREYGTVVKKYDFFNPKIDEVNNILNDTIKGCRNKHFFSFECRCVFHIKFINLKNDGELI